MPKQCITDYISIDNLQIILDETSLQDGIALRLWSPYLHENENSRGWLTPDWNNACHYHNLIRTYPSGHTYCYQFFAEQAQQIAQGSNIEWYTRKCPTALYIFGFPIHDRHGDILAILFGGLVRGDNTSLVSEEWEEAKKILEKDGALIRELENEFKYVPSLSKKSRYELFAKWETLCQIFSHLMRRPSLPAPHSEQWIEEFTSFHHCITLGCELIHFAQSQATEIQFGISNNPQDFGSVDCYQLKVTDKVSLENIGHCEVTQLDQQNDLIRVNKDIDISLTFPKSHLTRQDKDFFLEIGKTMASSIFVKNNAKESSRSRLLLERQSQIFEKVSRSSVTNLETMIVHLFDQLRETGVINIDYASFSEVVYVIDNNGKIKPCFKARVVYPSDKWTEEQKNIIERLDLHSDNPNQKGSTVYAFQKARSVLDRVAKSSPTYISTQDSVNSSLVIPISYGPLVLGVIAFDSEEEDYFDDERRVQLENLTQLISPVVYHNSFQERLDELNKEIKSIAKNMTPNSQKKIRMNILTTLSKLVQADAASFWVANNENTLSRDTFAGSAANLSMEIPIDKSSIGKLYKKEIANILIPDIEKQKSEEQLRYSSELIHNSFLSYLAFPVDIEGNRVIISFYRVKNKELSNREFSEVELNITQRLGQILSFYEALNNIFESQRHELEIQLESREELAITLAHNIKSPLSSTYARLDDLRRKIRNDLGLNAGTEDYTSLLDSINSNFFAIKRSTNSVLKLLSKREGYNVGVISVQAFHLYYDILVKQVSRIRRGLKIHEDSDAHLEKRIVEINGHKQFPLLYGDKTAIEDMIGNILENAVKYSSKDNKIYIESRFDYVLGEIILLFKNDGAIHIPKEDSERIFLYAYRSRFARDKYPGSTGVGLYYSRYIAEQHGGRLILENNQNPVIFKLTIPIDKLRTAEKAEDTISKSGGTK